MEHSLTVILADYLTGRISTTEALRRSNMQAVDDLVRAARSEGDEVEERQVLRRRHAATARLKMRA